jgi:hypothetical protein
LIFIFSLSSNVFSQTYVWNGNAGTNWNDPGNWLLGGTPAASYPIGGDDVIIGSISVTDWPLITSSFPGNCGSIEFTNNGHIDFDLGGVLTVKGDIVSNTTNPFTCFDLEEGTVLIQGSSDHDLDGFIGFSTLEIDCDGHNVDITAESEVLVHEYVKVRRGNLNTNMNINLTKFVLIAQHDGSIWRTAYFDWTGNGTITGDICSQQIVVSDIKTYHMMSSPVDSLGNGYFNKLYLNDFTDQTDFVSGTYQYGQNPIPDWIFYDETEEHPGFTGSSANWMYGWEGANYQQSNTLHRVTTGQGFCGRFKPYTFPNNDYIPFNFIGRMNNGTIPSPVLTLTNNSEDADGFNLIGNPYPSPLNWQAVYDEISYLKEIFVWQTNGTEYGGSFLTYDASTQGGTHDGIIPIAQGFFVSTGSNNYQFDFKNDHRLGQTRGDYFRRAPKVNAIKVDLKGKNNKDVVMICFDENFSNQYEKEEDIVKMMNPQNSFFVYHGGRKVSIEKQNFPVENKEIPLGLVIEEAGYYSFELKEDNLPPGQYKIYLEDRKNKIWRELKYGGSEFNFYAESGENNNRFYLHFYNTEKVLESQPVLSSGDFSVIKNGQLSIFVQEEPLERQKVSIHAVNGELLYQQDLFLLQGENRIPSLMLNKGCYLVNVSNSKENKTQRIVAID